MSYSFRLLTKKEYCLDGRLTLTPFQEHHYLHVLRLVKGTLLLIIIDTHEKWLVKVTHINRCVVYFDVLSKSILQIPKKPSITLVQCLPKQDKFTTILDYGTQIGVDVFRPIISSRTLVKGHNYEHKMNRWRKKIESASEQSQRYDIPMLYEPMSFKNWLNNFDSNSFDGLFLPWENECLTQGICLNPTKKWRSLIFFIGPEGGISDEECCLLKDVGFKSLSLGSTILRTEIAGFYAIASIKGQLEFLNTG